MTIIEALKLCQTGQRVRPVCWRDMRPAHWVEARPYILSGGDQSTLFVECGRLEEMPHRIDLQFEEEYLGDWEVMR